MGPVSQALDWLGSLPEALLVVLLSFGALLENVVPPVPADTFVVVGGLLAARGDVPAVAVFVGIWLANSLGALGIYWLGYARGRRVFDSGPGRWLLTPGQVTRISRFYERWGVPAILVARFLPGLRAVVPAFAGVSHLHWTRVVPPVVLASAVWYGALLWVGYNAEGSVRAAEVWLAGLNRGLLWAAVIVATLVTVWWWRTRHAVEDHADGGDGDGGDDAREGYP